MQAEGRSTKYSRPNVQKYDFPATKKRRTAQQTPVHVSVNITPTPGATSSAMQATYQVANATSSAPCPPHAAEVSVDTKSISAPGPSRPSTSPRCARLLALLDCIHADRTPSVRELLTPMDCKEPMAGLKFEDSTSDLEDFGMTNTLEVSKMPVELLMSMGSLGRDGSRRVHEYCQDKILGPLGEPRAKRSGSDTSVEEILPPRVSIKKARRILVEDSVEEVQPPQKIASKKKELLTASTSQRQLPREDIKMEDSWAWLDKVLEEEDAYVSVSKDEDEGEEDEENRSVAMSCEL